MQIISLYFLTTSNFMMFSSILTSLSVLALLGGSNAIPTPDKDTLAPRGYCQDNLGLVGGTFDVFIRLNIDMQGDVSSICLIDFVTNISDKHQISTPNPAKWSNSIGYSSKASFLTKCDIYEQRPVPDSTMYFKSRDTGACWHVSSFPEIHTYIVVHSLRGCASIGSSMEL